MMSDKEEIEDGVAGYIKPNVGLMLWLLLLGFGGGLLALYYESIDYFPDIKWEEALTYLMALSIFGGAIVLAYGLMIFIPGVIWSDFLIFDPQFEGYLCYKGAKGEEPCVMGTLRRIVAPFVCFILPVHWLPVKLTTVGAIWGLLYLILAGSVAYWINKDMFPGKGFWSLGSPPGRFVAFFILSALSSWVALALVRLMLLPQDDPSPWDPMNLICTLMICIANIFVSLQYRKRRGGAYLSGIIAAALLLVFGHLLADCGRETPSARFMSAFGIGYERTVTVVVSCQGAKIFQDHGILPGEVSLSSCPRMPSPIDSEKKDGEDSGKKDVEEPVFKIEDLEILSRLGSDYYIRSSTHKKTVSIPKKYILSWSYDEETSSSADSKCPQKAHSVAASEP